MARKILQNPYACPLRHSMNLIGSKWKPIIIFLLAKKPLRFGKLNALMSTISKKVLTDQLRELESDGIILRQKFAEIPPRVEYSLTVKGQAVVPIISALCKWSSEHMADVELQDGRNGRPLQQV